VKTPWRIWYDFRNRNWWQVDFVLWLIIVALFVFVFVGCAKGDSDRPAPPAIPGAPVMPMLPADASPEDREAHYRKEVERLTMTLEVAKTGLKVARAEAAEVEDKTWRTWTRWVGLAGIVLAVAAGGVLSWLVSPRVGIPVAAIVAACALSVVAYGATIRWLPLALGVSAALAGAVWLLYHLRHLKVADLAARAIDAVEEETEPLALKAKLALGSAVDRAGLRGRLNRVRGKV
jgi:hypothetical protein